jgi:hypothetical protein
MPPYGSLSTICRFSGMVLDDASPAEPPGCSPGTGSPVPTWCTGNAYAASRTTFGERETADAIDCAEGVCIAVSERHRGVLEANPVGGLSRPRAVSTEDRQADAPGAGCRSASASPPRAVVRRSSDGTLPNRPHTGSVIDFDQAVLDDRFAGGPIVPTRFSQSNPTSAHTGGASVSARRVRPLMPLLKSRSVHENAGLHGKQARGQARSGHGISSTRSSQSR